MSPWAIPRGKTGCHLFAEGINGGKILVTLERFPPLHLFAERIDVGKIFTILKNREPVHSNDIVKLGLGFPLHIRIENHREYEPAESRSGLRKSPGD
jgi:hypothetical protein